MRYLLGFSAALALLPAAAEAQGRWTTIYQDRNVTIEVDTSSVTERNANIVAWTQWTYAVSRPRREHLPAYKSMRARTEFACTNRQSRLLSAVYYDPKGFVVNTYEPDNEQLRNGGWADLVPDTLGESELIRVCEIAGRAS